MNLEKRVKDIRRRSLPCERLLVLHLVKKGVDISAEARCDIHVLGADEKAPVARVQLPAEVQSENERSGEVGLEEGFCVGGSTTDRLEKLLAPVLAGKIGWR